MIKMPVSVQIMKKPYFASDVHNILHQYIVIDKLTWPQTYDGYSALHIQHSMYLIGNS